MTRSVGREKNKKNIQQKNVLFRYSSTFFTESFVKFTVITNKYLKLNFFTD